MMKFLNTALFARVIPLVFSSLPVFGSIAWESPVGVSTVPGNSSDVSTHGVLVEAYNASLSGYTGGNQIVNGVSFVATTQLLDTDSSITADFSSGTNGGDISYDSILSTADFGGGDSTTIVVGDGDGDSTTSGAGLLQVGSLYEIQIWYVDDRSSLDSRTMGFAGNDSAPSAQLNEEYVIGTFTATETTQTLYLDTVSPTSGFGNCHLTAYQIRQLAQGPYPLLSSSSDSASGPFTVDVNFSEPVNGLEDSDFVIGNGTITLSSLVGMGATWSFEVNPSSNGDVTVELPAGTVSSVDGDIEANVVSNLLSVFYLAPGSDQPAVALSTAANPALGPFLVDLVFTEAVSGLDEGDFQVTGGSVSGLTGAGASYRVLVTPDLAEGEITVLLPANSVVDLDGDELSNLGSNTLVTTVEIPEFPTVAIYGKKATAEQSSEIHLTFSEDVGGLEASDFVVTNGRVSEVAPRGRARSQTENSYISSRLHYSATVIADASGTVTVSLPAGAVLSLDGNDEANAASNTFAITYESRDGTQWVVDDAAEWAVATAGSSSLTFADGFATPTADAAQFTSVVKDFPVRRKATEVTFRQSPVWDHWIPLGYDIQDSVGRDAPIFVPLGPGDYYVLALSGSVYHAWHSTDMISWTQRGAVTSGPEGRWVTSCEYKDGFFYIYSDYANDHTSHVFRDDDLGDGVPGVYLGPVLERDGSGSDLAVIRDDADGLFHLIYEDWSPIEARTHAWDSPLAGHTSSADGINGFFAMEHAAPVDQRTTPTGNFSSYSHQFVTFDPVYEIHSPEQDAYGDWTAIKIGEKYYLFGDYEPVGQSIRAARFVGDSLYSEFDFAGPIVTNGHPDPTVGFAEGQFYLITQYTDFRSPGPWVDGVEARAGVDEDGDGVTDTWTSWQAISEQYDYTPGYIRVVTMTPAGLDLSSLPDGYGFQVEFRIDDTVVAGVSPIMDAMQMNFEQSQFEAWADLNGAMASANGDRNANGVPNLVEFALGQSEVPERQTDGSLTLTVTSEALADGYVVGLQYSEDLVAWNAAKAETEGVTLIGSTLLANGDLQMEYSIEAPNGRSVFWRIMAF